MTKFLKMLIMFFIFCSGDIVPSIEKPDHYMQTNVIGTVKVLTSRENKIKNLFMQPHLHVMELRKHLLMKSIKFLHNTLMQLVNIWGSNPVFIGKVYNLPVVSIRIFNAYGPRVRTTVYMVLLEYFKTTFRKNLQFWRQQTKKRLPLLMAKAFYLAAKTKNNGQIYNLGANKPVSILKLANLIGGKKIYLPKRPRTKHLGKY